MATVTPLALRLAPPTHAAEIVFKITGTFLSPRRLVKLARTGRLRSVQLLDGSTAFDLDQLLEDVAALNHAGAA